MNTYEPQTHIKGTPIPEAIRDAMRKLRNAHHRIDHATNERVWTVDATETEPAVEVRVPR